jgi:hypothetical protein
VVARFEKSGVEVTRRRQRLLLSQLALAVLVPALFWLAAAGKLAPASVIAAMLILVGQALASLVLWLLWPHRTAGRLVATEDGAILEGRAVVSRKDVFAIIERPLATGGVVVRFEQRASVGASFAEVAVQSEEEAHALVSAMRLDGARAVMQHAATRGSTLHMAIGAAFVAAFVAAVLAVAATHAFPIAYLGALVLPILAAVSWANLTTTVGADGLRLSPGLGRARFISYGQVRAIDASGTNVRIELASGETVAVCFGPVAGFEWAGSAVLADQARTLVARVRERMQAVAAATPSRVAATLARGGRTTEAWIADITRTPDGSKVFRVTAVPAHVLLAVVEDETVAPDARAGAAVALRHASTDLAARDRMRVAAEACAEPNLRVALQAAARADGDGGDDLVNALDGFEKGARRALRG